MQENMTPSMRGLDFDEDDIIFDICPVCLWQYDVAAHNHPDTLIGANAVTLNQARENFELFGVFDKRFVGRGRKPFPEELPENNQ